LEKSFNKLIFLKIGVVLREICVKHWIRHVAFGYVMRKKKNYIKGIKMRGDLLFFHGNKISLQNQFCDFMRVDLNPTPHEKKYTYLIHSVTLCLHKIINLHYNTVIFALYEAPDHLSWDLLDCVSNIQGEKISSGFLKS
jgi:hypothetical protein